MSPNIGIDLDPLTLIAGWAASFRPDCQCSGRFQVLRRKQDNDRLRVVIAVKAQLDPHVSRRISPHLDDLSIDGILKSPWDPHLGSYL